MVTRVVKLGGSLLELSDWAERLRNWLGDQAPATNLIVVGGGERVEALRELQKVDCFSDELAHVHALQLMDVNAAEVAHSLAFAAFVRRWRPEAALPAEGTLVLECGEWAAGQPIFERSWRTTSDSVAAEIASRLGTEELVLMKSCLPLAGIQEVVDPRFEGHVRRGQLVRVVNLRDAAFPETAWRKELQPNEPTRR